MPITITPRSVAAATTTTTAALTAFLASPLLTPAPAQLLLVLESNSSSDSIPASNIVLHVPANAAPSPFLNPGPFTATWTGSLNLDLRSDFRFRADHAGAFTLQINGSNILESTHTPGTTDWSAPVRLRKGTNTLTATLTRTNDAPAHIRLSWQNRTTPPSPIPPHLLTPPPATAPHPSRSIARHGRHLFLSLRCAACHTADVSHPVPDLTPPAPALTSLGSRRSPAWIQRWIANPHAHRPSTAMPRTLRGPNATATANAIADWLSSLNQPGIPSPNPPQGVPAVGQSLFADLLCHACHTLPGEPESPEKVSLAGIPTKFPSPEALTDELRFPHRFDPWRRMPDFSLDPEEAAHLAAFLLPRPTPETAQPEPRPTLPADQAREAHSLAIRHGCFQCHPDPAPSPNPVTPAYKAPAANQLASAQPTAGCIADTEPSQTESSQPFPWYPLQPSDRQALRAFLATDPDMRSLGRHVPTDFAERWSRELRCQSCHDAVEGLPPISLAGEKLRPEWLHRLLRGEIGYKPRPWLPHRMPAFPAFAQPLAEGLAAAAGLPPVSPPEPPPDPEAAGVGRKLVAASAGFACVTCHAIGPFQASAVFEAPGINLAHTADRLLPDFFIRWVRNPQAIDPTTKMPLYFDEAGNSALADYYDGDGPKTLNALWQYLRQGPSMVPPEP